MASNHVGKRSGTSSEAGPSEKKLKTDNDNSFEISSALVDEMEIIQHEELFNDKPHPSTTSPHPPVTPIIEGNCVMGTRKDWLRPPPPPIDPAKDTISFQQIDINHYIGSPISGMPGVKCGPVPILRMYGVTMEGNSVCAHLHGFLPYFYIPLPCEQFKNEHCSDFQKSLNDAVLGDMRNQGNTSVAVVSVDICQKCSMYGFHFNKMYPFLKITMSSPKLIAPAKRIVSSFEMAPFKTVCYQSYESNIEYEIRFMVDSGVIRCNWIDCPPGSN